jgi:hypothetical protein
MRKRFRLVRGDFFEKVCAVFSQLRKNNAGLPEIQWSPSMGQQNTTLQDAQKFVQQGRSKRRGDPYSVRYVEPLSEARTPLAEFVSILLEFRTIPSPVSIVATVWLQVFTYRLHSPQWYK